MRGRRKAPKIVLTDEEKTVFEKIAGLADPCGRWFIGIRRDYGDKSAWDVALTRDRTRRVYGIALQTAAKRIDGEIGWNDYRTLPKHERETWENLCFGRLAVLWH